MSDYLKNKTQKILKELDDFLNQSEEQNEADK